METAKCATYRPLEWRKLASCCVEPSACVTKCNEGFVSVSARERLEASERTELMSEEKELTGELKERCEKARKEYDAFLSEFCDKLNEKNKEMEALEDEVIEKYGETTKGLAQTRMMNNSIAGLFELVAAKDSLTLLLACDRLGKELKKLTKFMIAELVDGISASVEASEKGEGEAAKA